MLEINTLGKKYNIDIFNNESLSEKILSKFGKASYILITESGIPQEKILKIESDLKNQNCEVCKILLPESGEKNKSATTSFNIIEKIFKETKITRKSVLIGIGGGVIGDLSGFIASILMRGIKYINIPTSLLAMVDSSVGGKTGINFFNIKNTIGTFYQPDLVLCDIDFLKTLSYRQYISGYSEIFKHAIISEEFGNFFEYLTLNSGKTKNRDINHLNKIIKMSCKIKKNIVEKDEFETLGIRSFLNIGHTIAHTIEKFPELDGEILHGEAVAVGIVVEMKISKEFGILKNFELIEKTENHFKDLGFNLNLEKLTTMSKKEIIKKISEKTQVDKKNELSENNSIKIGFALIEEINKIKNVSLEISQLEDILNKII